MHRAAIMQVQSRLLDEQGFRDTVAVLQASQARLRTHMRARLASRLDANMQRCLALSRARAARQRRVERLKRDLQHKRGFIGADPKLMLHDAVLLSPRPGAAGHRVEDGHSIDTQSSTSFVGNLRQGTAEDVPAVASGGKAGATSDACADGGSALVRIHSMDGDAMQGAGRSDSTGADPLSSGMPDRYQSGLSRFDPLHSNLRCGTPPWRACVAPAVRAM